MIDLTRDEIEAMLHVARFGVMRNIVDPTHRAALDRAVVKLHVELVHVAMEMIPSCAVPGCVATHRTTESELRLLDGNR